MIGYIPIWGNSVEYFNQLKILNNVTSIVILGEVEFHYDRIRGNKQLLLMVCEYAESKNIPVYFITGLSKLDAHLLPPDHVLYNRFTLIFWPTYWFLYTFMMLNKQETKIVNDKNGLDIELITPYKDYAHTFVSMNNMPHRHRLAMMDMFAKYKLLDTNKISFRKLNQATFIHWNDPKPLFLEQETDEENISFLNRELLPKCYNDCFMHVIGESDFEKYTISGSVTTPLLFNKPFLTLGNINYMEYLESFGFLRYDEIFDYSFDSIENLEERAEALVKEVSRIESLKDQFKEMYSKIYPKLIHNRKLALKYVFDRSTFPPMFLQISEQEFIPTELVPFKYLHHPNNFIGFLNDFYDKFQRQL